MFRVYFCRQCRYAAASALVSFLCANLAYAEVDVELTDYRLGVGVNTLTGDVRGDCVERREADPVEIPAGSTEFQITQIERSEELYNFMGVATKASFTGGFGSVGGKADWIKSRRFNEYSIFMALAVRVRGGEEAMRDVRLKDEWVAILETGDAGHARFNEACGDHFVIGIKKGGEFLAIFELRTNSNEEKELLKASIQANGITGTWEASGDIENRLEKIQRMSELSTYMYRTGAGLGLPDPNAARAIREYALNFPALVRESENATVAATVIDYLSLPNIPSMNPGEVVQQNFVLDNLATHNLLAKTLLDNAVYVLSRSSEFTPFERDDIRALEQELSSIQASIAADVAACIQDSGACRTRPYSDLYALRDKLPSRVESLPVAGRCSTSDERFATVNGGCRDLATGTIWGKQASVNFTLPQARTYCTESTESGHADWVLPREIDLFSIQGSTGVAADASEWFWSVEGKAVDIALTYSRSLPPQFRLRVLCKRAL